MSKKCSEFVPTDGMLKNFYNKEYSADLSAESVDIYSLTMKLNIY